MASDTTAFQVAVPQQCCGFTYVRFRDRDQEASRKDGALCKSPHTDESLRHVVPKLKDAHIFGRYFNRENVPVDW